MKKSHSNMASQLLPWVTGMAVLAASASGCGKQSFVVTDTKQSQQSPGSFFIPPRVDIVLLQDDTGGIKQAQADLNAGIPGFLSNLESSGWDYHFATVPMTNDRALSQIMTSKHDSNWGSLWTPAYPGQSALDPSMVISSFFRQPPGSPSQAYSGFVDPNTVNSASAGWEPSLANLDKALNVREPGTHFLRDDAMLVVLIVGNGDDTSDVWYCNRGDAYVPCKTIARNNVPMSINHQCKKNGTLFTCSDAQVLADTSYDDSLNNYRNRLIALKNQDHMLDVNQPETRLRVFSAVSQYKVTNESCRSGNAFVGSRYIQLSNSLGGGSSQSQFSDVCSVSIGQTLAGLQGVLESQKLDYQTRFLFIQRDARVETLKVTKYSNGQTIDLPQDATNGWTYVGGPVTQYAIDYPVPMNQQTGYAIELHGTAKLHGDDSADVSYKPVGSQDTVTR